MITTRPAATRGHFDFGWLVVIPRAAAVSSVNSKMFSSTGAGAGVFFSTPSSPAASMTANARYGFALGSGQRSSARTAFSRPFVMRGMRMSAERLRCPHAT